MYRFPLTVLLCFALGANYLYAQQTIKMTPKHVTVFFRGTEMDNIAKVTLPVGESQVLFTNMADYINQESITVGTDNGNVIIQSVTFLDMYSDTNITINPLTKIYKDSLALIISKRQLTDNKLSVIKEQIAIIKANEKVSGNNADLSIAVLEKMLDVVNTRMGTLLNEKSALENQLKQMDTQVERLKNEGPGLEKLPGGEVLVKFYTQQAATITAYINYIANDGSWESAYDMRTAKIGDAIILVHKAIIFQGTRVNWENVSISLSTGNPNENATAPTFSSNYLSFYQPGIYSASPMAFEKSIKMSNVSAERITHADNQATTFVSPVATTYDIETPYSIPAGQKQQVDINTQKLPVTYRFYVYPKADNNAYLQAQLTDWGNVDITPGSANIYFGGTYVGQTYIDLHTVTDTLTFSLGRDKKIVVKRIQDTKMRSTKTIGSNVKEQYGYTITVRNTHAQPVDIVVADQVPVSTDKDISIEDIETSGGNYNETTGEVNWHLTLNANEAKDLKLGYTIKYPKGKTLTSH
ncbi:MAG: mucoidy inhibitor MuiA family protein [Flavipsychrobacter sp.]|nr:mucoidy inhibitor MuiA family protein [Flavipsychrobacter sp.]